ncbi:MAG TPA: peptidase dimerization domain-containing protein [Candidatus Avidesulfovibrio excrementigallinarum]|nr:peptidase dimerization domain-containing protein [Candidatus Avidesulfovibrio excrementigallinarum]
MGTPAEEAVIPGAGGKLRCIEAGLFDGLDAVMMCHAAARDILETTVAARTVLNLEFFGKAAHAGADPHQGLNALTAAVQTLNGLNGLYQQLTPGHRINAIVTDGGKVVNVIPEHAALAVQLRAPTRAELDRLKEKILDCARAGALMTGCRFTAEEPSPAVSDLVPSRPLLETYAASAQRLGVSPVRELETCISTDAGTVSHHLPCIHPFFAVGCDPGLELHSRAFAEACGRETAFRQLCTAAKILALTGYEVLSDPELRRRIRDEFLSRTNRTNSTRSF